MYENKTNDSNGAGGIRCDGDACAAVARPAFRELVGEIQRGCPIEGLAWIEREPNRFQIHVYVPKARPHGLLRLCKMQEKDKEQTSVIGVINEANCKISRFKLADFVKYCVLK